MYIDQATPLIAYTQDALLLQRKRRALESESVSGSTWTLSDSFPDSHPDPDPYLYSDADQVYDPADCDPDSIRSIAVCNQLQRYENFRAIWDHTVLPATRQR